MAEIDLLREAGLQLWLSAGSSARILENGQSQIPDVANQVATDVRARMAAFKETKDRQFYPWEIADPHDERFMTWIRGGERLTDLVINLTVYRRDDQRFVVFNQAGCYWLPDSYGEDPVLAAHQFAAELQARADALPRSEVVGPVELVLIHGHDRDGGQQAKHSRDKGPTEQKTHDPLPGLF